MGKIIEVMKTLGYPADDGGVCFGIANMARRAYLLKDYKTFSERMTYIEDLSTEDIDQLNETIDAACKRLVDSGQNPAPKPSVWQDTVLSLQAFSLGVALYQSPNSYSDILPNSNKMIFQMNAITEIDALILDGLSDIPAANRNPLLTLALVSRQPEYLSKFFSILQQSPTQSIGIVAISSYHAIFLHYQDDLWYLTNHSTLKTYNSIDLLAIDFTAAFTKDNNVILSMRLYTCNKINGLQDAIDNWKSCLKEINSEQGWAIALNDTDSASLIPENLVNLRDSNSGNLLFVACREGHTSLIKSLLSIPTLEINQKTNDGSTPLVIACQNNHISIVETLLSQQNIDINAATIDGITPLYIACKKGNLEIVKALLAKRRIKINFQRKTGSTPLFIACQYNQVAVVEALLAHPKVEVNKPTTSGNTPLNTACEFGHADIVQTLLKRGDIDINHADNYGYSPLLSACMSGNKDVVNLLLNQEKINLDVVTKTGASPLYLAAFHNHPNVIKPLLKSSPDLINQGKTVNLAEHLKKTDPKYTFVLERFQNLNLRFENFTPLHAAALLGHDEIVKILLEFGANRDSKANEDITALTLAEIMNQEPIMRMLSTNPPQSEKPLQVLTMPVQYDSETSRLLINKLASMSNSRNHRVDRLTAGHILVSDAWFQHLESQVLAPMQQELDRLGKDQGNFWRAAGTTKNQVWQQARDFLIALIADTLDACIQGHETLPVNLVETVKAKMREPLIEKLSELKASPIVAINRNPIAAFCMKFFGLVLGLCGLTIPLYFSSYRQFFFSNTSQQCVGRIIDNIPAIPCQSA